MRARLAIAVLVACSRTPVEETNSYVLDFSKSSMNRGLFVQRFSHVEFSVDVDRPLRTYDVTLTSIARDDLVIYEDFLSCPRTVLGGTDGVTQVEAGTPAHVTSVDVVLSDIGAVSWQGAGVCFAYRTPDGLWHTETLAKATSFATDSALKRVRAKLSVDKQPVDALTLWFTNDTPRLALQSITYTIQP